MLVRVRLTSSSTQIRSPPQVWPVWCGGVPAEPPSRTWASSRPPHTWWTCTQTGRERNVKLLTFTNLLLPKTQLTKHFPWEEIAESKNSATSIKYLVRGNKLLISLSLYLQIFHQIFTSSGTFWKFSNIDQLITDGMIGLVYIGRGPLCKWTCLHICVCGVSSTLSPWYLKEEK